MSGKTKKIAVKVFIVRDETEEIEVESRTLETLTLTTLQNIIKNNFSKVLAYEGKHKKDNVKALNTECTMTINTTVNTVTRNPKKTVKMP